MPWIEPVGTIRLCVDAFGDPDDPAVLLVAGMGSPMDWWEPAFCERLAAGRRYVIRYDQRDTGRSTTCAPGTPDYTFADLVGDVVGLLDALGIERAHVVGISMGGAVAQHVALRFPDRVASLTLLSTTAAVDRPPDAPALPPMGSGLVDEPPTPEGTVAGDVVEDLVADQRRMVPHGFDEGRTRAVATAIVARSIDVRAGGNHALLDDGQPTLGTTADIAVRTLVIHGSQDPLITVEHGAALAREIPDATLLVIEGMGHEVPPPSSWEVVVPALLRHTSEV